MKLSKTSIDKKKEASDLEKDPVMQYLMHSQKTKFNVGDILIKKEVSYDVDDNVIWETERDWQYGLPIQYVYAFENTLGIGYIKLLNEDGSGPTKKAPKAMTRFNPSKEYFVLDPEYADHLLLGEGEFAYHLSRQNKIKYREEALKKNKQLLISQNKEDIKKWWDSLKVGDTIYTGDDKDDISDLGEEIYIVKSISGKKIRRIEIERIKCPWGEIGEEFKLCRSEFLEYFSTFSTSKPYPLSEDQI